jgi:hypothetical protein
MSESDVVCYLELCGDCARNIGLNMALGHGRVDGCDACREQHKLAARYELSDVVAALVAQRVGGTK